MKYPLLFLITIVCFIGCFGKEIKPTKDIEPGLVYLGTEDWGEFLDDLSEGNYNESSDINEHWSGNARWNKGQFLTAYNLFSNHDRLVGVNDFLVPNLNIEIYDIDNNDKADTIVLNAWYEENNPIYFDMDDSYKLNYEMLDYSVLTPWRTPISSERSTPFPPMIRKVLYMPEGMERSLLSHQFYRFFMETEDLRINLETLGYLAPNNGQSYFFKIAQELAMKTPDLPTISPEDFEMLLNEFLNLDISFGADGLENHTTLSSDYKIFYDGSSKYGDYTPFIIEFSRYNQTVREAPSNLGDTWNHIAPDPHVLFVTKDIESDDYYTIRTQLRLSPYLHYEAIRALLERAAQELELLDSQVSFGISPEERILDQLSNSSWLGSSDGGDDIVAGSFFTGYEFMIESQFSYIIKHVAPDDYLIRGQYSIENNVLITSPFLNEPIIDGFGSPVNLESLPEDFIKDDVKWSFSDDGSSNIVFTGKLQGESGYQFWDTGNFIEPGKPLSIGSTDAVSVEKIIRSLSSNSNIRTGPGVEYEPVKDVFPQSPFYPEGESLLLIARTESKTSVPGFDEDYWYYVETQQSSITSTGPQKGWIFGALIDMADNLQ